MTAAHKTLPFGTRIRVTRHGGPSVVVKVNDCCGCTHGRIVDLSEAAARKLDMMHAGVVQVRSGGLTLTATYRRLPPSTFRIGPVIAIPIAPLSTAPSISTCAPSDLIDAAPSPARGLAVLGLELPVSALEVAPSNRSAKLCQRKV